MFTDEKNSETYIFAATIQSSMHQSVICNNSLICKFYIIGNRVKNII